MFSSLAYLETLTPGTREFEALAKSLYDTAADRERDGKKAQDNVEKYRARVVLFHVDRLRRDPGRDPATEPDTSLDWLPHEAWLATRALRPGLYRALTAVAALEEPHANRTERAAWAERLFAEERARLDLDLAARLAEGLHRHARDVESAARLAALEVARGDGAAARSVLDTALGAGPGPAEEAALKRERARLLAALHDRAAARVDFGAALAGGDREAALDLALEALADRDGVAAGFLARRVLAQDPSHEEARATLGLALLARLEQGRLPDATLGSPSSLPRNPARAGH